MTGKITFEKTSILVNNVSSIKDYFLVLKERTYLLSFLFIEMILLLAIPAVSSLFTKNSSQTSLAYGYILIIILIIFILFIAIIAFFIALLVYPIYILLNSILGVFSIHYVDLLPFYFVFFILGLICFFFALSFFIRGNSKLEIKADSIVCYRKIFFKKTYVLLDGDRIVFNKVYYMPHTRIENKIIPRWIIAKQNYFTGFYQPIFILKGISDNEILNLMADIVDQFKIKVEINHNHNESINSNAGLLSEYNQFIGNFTYQKFNDDIKLEFKVKTGLLKNILTYYNIIAPIILLLNQVKGIVIDGSLNFPSALLFTSNLMVYLIFFAFLSYILYTALRELNLFIIFDLNSSKNEFRVVYKNIFKFKVLFTIPLSQINQFNIIRVNYYFFTIFMHGKSFGLGLEYPIEYYQAQEIIQLLNKNLQSSFT